MLAVADLLRHLHDAYEYSVIGVGLRTPSDHQAVVNCAPCPYSASAFTLAQRRTPVFT